MWRTAPACEAEVPSSLSGRAARSKPDIYHLPFFRPETATRSRVVTPDSAIAESWVSPLGGGASSVREESGLIYHIMIETELPECLRDMQRCPATNQPSSVIAISQY